MIGRRNKLNHLIASAQDGGRATRQYDPLRDRHCRHDTADMSDFANDGGVGLHDGLSVDKAVLG